MGVTFSLISGGKTFERGERIMKLKTKNKFLKVIIFLLVLVEILILIKNGAITINL